MKHWISNIIKKIANNQIATIVVCQTDIAWRQIEERLDFTHFDDDPVNGITPILAAVNAGF